MIAVLLCTVLPILFSDTVCAKYFVYTPEEESTADPDELYGNFEEAVLRSFFRCIRTSSEVR